ncbi:MAG: hypothetical protein K2K06_09975 [Oscillospiraceae bacterium]|nr:hypothetical protein [Oscillospiraceae bacterium]
MMKTLKKLQAIQCFMKMCKAEMQNKFPEFSVAHERDGKYFACASRIFYISPSSDGLELVPNEQEENNSRVDWMYDTITNHFDTRGIAYKIPYTVAQLRALKKKSKKFFVGYRLSEISDEINDEQQHYAIVDIDYLILAMEITGSDILLTDDLCRMVMKNEDGDCVGMICSVGKQEIFHQVLILETKVR